MDGLSEPVCTRDWSSKRPGGTPCNDSCAEAPPERGTFFRLQIHERVEILLVEVYERVGKSVIWVCERDKGLTEKFYGFIKSRKRSIFVINSYLNDSAFTVVKRGCKVLNKVCERGTICQYKIYKRGTTFLVKNGMHL